MAMAAAVVGPCGCGVPSRKGLPAVVASNEARRGEARQGERGLWGWRLKGQKSVGEGGQDAAADR